MTTLYLIAQICSLIGLISGLLMFWSPRKLEADHENDGFPFLSIIIPARNEALRLPRLLKSLQAQKYQQFEVIVVDDGSTDRTIDVANSYGAKPIKSEPISQMKPGKANALAHGSRHANGDWLLFLDADVELTDPNSLVKILASFAQQNGKGILSIQPYHEVVKHYENLSVIFNIIVLTGMNVFTYWKEKFKTAGSFGPCIVCDKESYHLTGGHEKSEESIMDDFALSDVFFAKNLPVTNYVGKGIINIRMYEEGYQQLSEGWTKNLATASQSTHPFVMTLIQLWIFGVIMAVAAPILALIVGSPLATFVSILFYLVYGTHTYLLARRAGNFKATVLLFYPLYILFFTAIFLYSLYRTHIVGSVMWRGRKIDL